MRDIKEVRRIMHRSSSPVAGFIQDCLIQKDGNRISKEAMFEIYSYWANKTGATRLTKAQLGRNLYKYAKYLIAKNDTERFWENATFNLESSFIKQNIEYLDTLDTFKNIMSNCLDNSQNNNKNSIISSLIDNSLMIKNKASNPSKPLDTLDTSSQKDEDLEVTE